MEWISGMGFDDTWPAKKRLPQTISASIVWFIYQASTAGLLCLTLSPSVQADEFQKKFLDVSHPATYWAELKKLNQITIGEKEKSYLSLELLELSVFADREGWRGSGGGRKSETSTTSS